jgi:hypothetical protein
MQKESISIPSSHLLGNTSVIIKVKYHGQDGSVSNIGKLTLSKEPRGAYITLEGDARSLCVNAPTDIVLGYSEYSIVMLNYVLTDSKGNKVLQGRFVDPLDIAFKALVIPNDNLVNNEYYTLTISASTITNHSIYNEFKLLARVCDEVCAVDKSLHNVTYGMSRPRIDFNNTTTEILDGNMLPAVTNGNLVLFRYTSIISQNNPPIATSLTNLITLPGYVELFVNGFNVFVVGYKDNDMVILKYRYYKHAAYIKLVGKLLIPVDRHNPIRLMSFTTKINDMHFDGGIVTPTGVNLFSIDEGKTFPVETAASGGLANATIVPLCLSGRFIKMLNGRFYLYSSLFDSEAIDSIPFPDVVVNKSYFLIKRDRKSATFIARSRSTGAYGVYRILASETELSIVVEVVNVGVDLHRAFAMALPGGEVLTIKKFRELRYALIKG